jgi:hypothetical protein
VRFGVWIASYARDCRTELPGGQRFRQNGKATGRPFLIMGLNRPAPPRFP